MEVFLSRRQNPFLILYPHSQEGPVTVGRITGWAGKDLKFLRAIKIGVYYVVVASQHGHRRMHYRTRGCGTPAIGRRLRGVPSLSLERNVPNESSEVGFSWRSESAEERE